MDINDNNADQEELEYRRILNSIEEIANNDIVYTKNREDFPSIDDDEAMRMLTDAKHEIFVELNINILSKNESDESAMPSIKQCYTNHYRIPIPDENKEREYMVSFIQHFEKAMGQSIQ